jgi:hypothetical protein
LANFWQGGQPTWYKFSFARAVDGRAFGGPVVIADLSVIFVVAPRSDHTGARFDHELIIQATTIVERVLGRPVS